MERCAKCGRAHFRDAPCGETPGSGPAISAPDPAPILARANLLRMRARWAEAGDLCVEVLRLDPTNATAHSLLGDIYQDQGRAEEARHWYQLALEINPTSEADRAKLARAEEALEARQQRAEWAAIIEGRSQPVATSLLIRESVQRMAAIIGAGVCGIVLVMATFASLHERGVGAGEDPSSPSITRSRTRAVSSAETWREQGLMKRARASAERSLSELARVEIDPVAQALEVRAFFPLSARAGLTTPRVRERIMREAYRWAFIVRNAAAAQREREELTQRVRVSVLGPPDAAITPTGFELLFSGQLSRSDLVVHPDVVTPQELEQFFAAIEPPRWGGDLGAG